MGGVGEDALRMLDTPVTVFEIFACLYEVNQRNICDSTTFHHFPSIIIILYLNGLPHTVDMSHREAIRYYTSPFIETHVMQASFVAGFVPAVRGPRLNAGKRLLDVLMRHLLKIQKPALPMGARSELAVLVVSDGKVARCLAA